ncbi:MAG: decarboxylating 6-phosphogluconate dehydrogenase [Candidatus Solibacter usitatus]|nr:decarboxylating 6-phosphogluconate dehydrogenase [Candidatus Solibacter usitatus]
MQIGMIGLGRMGGNMVERLLQRGHQVVAYTRDQAKVQKAVEVGARGAKDLKDLVAQLPTPRSIWIMVPAGQATQDMIDQLLPLISPGDLLIDGGNSKYTDDIARYAALKPKGIHYMDAGTSGGVWGLKVGYCLMVGGDVEDFKRIEPALTALAPPNGLMHCGPAGSGHFVKMVHNGIEYGLMQAYAEGFEILKASRYDLDLAKIANLWNQGSVVRSWLLELTALALEADPGLDKLGAWVEDSGEGRWTVEESINLSVPAPVIALSLQMRFRSRQENSFSSRMLAAMRQQFGGHAVKEKK